MSKLLNASECSQCIEEAATEAKQHCPEWNGARVHFDGCFLRYENNSFYHEGVDPGKYHYCASTNDSDPQTFLQKAKDLSTQLITNASAKNSYTFGSINGTLYGLAQCWPSLTNSVCQQCLNDAQNLLLTCPPRSEGRGLEAGCFMRYSTNSFFTDNQITSSSPNLTPASSKSKSKIMPIVLGTLGGAALVASIMYLRRIRHRKNYDRTLDENLDARENFEQFILDYEVLRNSTVNFDRNNILGRGGFGVVYKV